MHQPRRPALTWAAGAGLLAAFSLAGGALAGTAALGSDRVSHTAPPFLSSFHTITKIASTVPSLGTGKPGNGDVNPYGVAVVPRSVGSLVAGDVLVSNFNDSANNQGTGRTIMQVSSAGKASVFADLGTQVSGPVGLTTALSVFGNGDVVVGSLPTTNGTAATATAGALYVLNSTGRLIETIKGGDINGPWDMTAYDGGEFGVLFVTNVLNGTVAAHGKTWRRAPSYASCWISAFRPRRWTRSSSSGRVSMRRRILQPWCSVRRELRWPPTERCTSPTRWRTASPPSPTRCSG
ncbi:MAG: hypothetical protein ABSD78_15510 [Acidimicrobiales bacterium]